MTRPTRIEVVGMGTVVQVAHLPALASHNDVEIVGMCDVDMPKALALAARFDIRDSSIDDQVLLHRTIEAIYRSAREGRAVAA